jgi:hypothetical protein
MSFAALSPVVTANSAACRSAIGSIARNNFVFWRLRFFEICGSRFFKYLFSLIVFFCGSDPQVSCAHPSARRHRPAPADTYVPFYDKTLVL